ncbi:peptidoglycan DD-metalloendopeptidase family protein [Meridianimaribacter flavus]|jgi:murein DD-endopeptidase MepM/ murein hydrolase activator NlpD|uniref:Murein DD-endopeptidase MepM/ murein hydrolase activator NlpD n=1 Tax=Meridianimaribacter flavus TaxID=571115 RepID=A0ABY2G7J2_9FLAO|nr:peptidoglycan DD-metalloendopeptidase family protein [Meridianimaribacter flavus]TDY13777.1 murein DD-endopeptidase MepM/ murein hydrolase activator NlpD [Meridianimaribacter flavus]
MQSKKLLIALLIFTSILSCKDDEKEKIEEVPLQTFVEPEGIKEFGFNLNDYIVKRDTIKSGDSFGVILERNNLGYPKIFQIAERAKDTFDITKLQVGKPYTLLCAKDSIQTPRCFIYQPNKEEYVVVNFHDSIHAYTSRKPIKYVEKVATGTISSNISEALEEQGLSPRLAFKMADEIYAWTIDFRRLQPGDRFKVIYTDKYIDDSIYAGVHNIKAAFFEHNKEPFYAFQFETDSTKGIKDYFNEEAKNLRRAFLKMPVKYGRLSSRYNLKRRIAYYGYKIRPHKGTDFAAPVGTEIMATANGTVTESRRKGGNGNYVKIRHNATYSTQYLHMSRRKVKVGDYVKQGDVIGWVGMTGNTGGPHVCYRFWKNGKQVDPFREKLPEAEPISDSLKVRYLEYIKPIRTQLDNILFEEQEPEIELAIEDDIIS